MNNPNPKVYTPADRNQETSSATDPLVIEIFDLIRDIKDPEHPHTLEELNVVSEESISITYPSLSEDGLTSMTVAASSSSPAPSTPKQDESEAWIRLEFMPTVPHCSLATLIGLCLRVKLERNLMLKHKLDIVVGEGTHAIEGDVNKQINDKERVAAAMENPDLRDMVEECIKEVDY